MASNISSSSSNRAPKHCLRNRQVTKNNSKKSKKYQYKENQKVLADKENVMSDSDRPRNSTAAQNLENLYEFENRHNILESDDELENERENDANVNEDSGEGEFYQPLENEGDMDQTDVTVNLNHRVEKNKSKKMYKDLKNDIYATNQRIDDLVNEWKGVKSALRRMAPQNRSDDESEIEDYDLLPSFPRKKYKHVVLMEKDMANGSYKKQFIAKLRTVGGKNIKKNVINIFKMLFTNKLKSKICWKGSDDKKPFENFVNILDALRQAVRFRHKKCSAEEIAEECKLRFKQADKDLERELRKKANR